MKKKYYFYFKFFIIIFIPFKVASQQDIVLNGSVVMQNSAYNTGKVTFVSGAAVSSPVKSIPTSTNVKGDFALIFSDRPIGDAVRVFVKKDGLEVVNKKDLEAASILGRLSPLKVVMCKVGQLEENQIKYYEITNKAVTQIYERRLAILLKKQGLMYQLVVDSLQYEMKVQISNLEEALAVLGKQSQKLQKAYDDLAEKFIVINLDDEDKTYQNAFYFFTEGKIPEAIAVFDSIDLRKRLTDNYAIIVKSQISINELQKIQDTAKFQVKQDIKQCMFKAKLHELNLENEKAEEFYILAIENDSNNIDNLWAFAAFLSYQDKKEYAIAVFNKILSLKPSARTSAQINWYIAQNYWSLKKFKEADLYFKLGLEIANKLFSKDPNEYAFFMEISIDYLLYKISSHNEVSKNELNTLKKRATRITDKNLNIYYSIKIDNLTLSNYYKDSWLMFKEDSDEAFIAKTKKNLELLQRIETLNSAITIQDIAFLIAETKSNLAYLKMRLWTSYKNGYSTSDADKKYWALFDKYLDLVNKKKKDTLQIGNVINQLNKAREKKDVWDANRNLQIEKCFLEAESSYNELLEFVESSKYLGKKVLYNTYNDISRFYGNVDYSTNSRKKHLVKASQIQQKVYDFYKEAGLKNPQQYEINLGYSAKNLAWYYCRSDSFDLAEIYAKEAMKIFEKWAAKSSIFNDSEKYAQNTLVVIYQRYFDYLNDLKDLPSEKVWKMEIVVNKMEGIINEKSLGNKLLGNYCSMLAGNLLSSKKFELAESYARKSLTIYYNDKSKNNSYLLDIQRILAHSLLFQKKYSESENIYMYLITKKDIFEQPYKIRILEDFKKFEEQGITHPDLDKIRQKIGN